MRIQLVPLILFVFSINVGLASESIKPVTRANAHLSEIFADWVTNRDLKEYVKMLPPEFSNTLLSLDENAKWIDMGSGDSFAIKEYNRGNGRTGSSSIPDERHSNPLGRPAYEVNAVVNALNMREAATKAKVLGVTVEPPEFPVAVNDKIRVRVGDFVEDIPASELGPADLITDFYGPFSYSVSPQLVLKKYWDTLREGGKAFIFLGTSRSLIYADGKSDGPENWVRWLTPFEVRVHRMSWLRVLELQKINSDLTYVVEPMLMVRFDKDGIDQTVGDTTFILCDDSSLGLLQKIYKLKEKMTVEECLDEASTALDRLKISLKAQPFIDSLKGLGSQFF